MTQYSTNSDFSTDAAGTTAHGTATAAITGWTHQHPLGAFSDLRLTVITEEGGTEGGKFALIDDTGFGNAAHLVSMNGPGSIAAETETEVLFRFRIAAALSGSTTLGKFRSEVPPGNHYTLQADASGNVVLWYYVGTSPSTTVGASVTKGLVADTWYWARVYVTTAGAWSWRVWSGAVGDEGAWDVSAASNATQNSGYVGIGMLASTQILHYDWFSVGTAGDAAPSPGAPAGLDPIVLRTRRV